METVNKLLAIERVQSVTFTKDTVTIVSNNVSHKYSMGYFVENIVPKLTKEQG